MDDRALHAHARVAWSCVVCRWNLFAQLETAFFANMAVTDVEHRHLALLFTLLGLMATWRHYVVWRRRRAQRGIDLLGTEAGSDSCVPGPKWAR
ncbi:MAG: hypothetical protein KatS3mg042_1061 [Rhodothermaceae bacterium]|nr:MAG: hypothetical protein KatS3mg042_1061 [Rhodothermaceae bacterium]